MDAAAIGSKLLFGFLPVLVLVFFGGYIVFSLQKIFARFLVAFIPLLVAFVAFILAPSEEPQGELAIRAWLAGLLILSGIGVVLANSGFLLATIHELEAKVALLERKTIVIGAAEEITNPSKPSV